MQRLRVLLLVMLTSAALLLGTALPQTARAEGGAGQIGGSLVCAVISNLCQNSTTPTLILSLTVSPGTTGQQVFTVTFNNAVSGTAQGTINYTYWWNCNGYDAETSVAVVSAPGACGDPTNPANGFKVIGTTANPYITLHGYNQGTYKYKVIVERDTAAPQTATVVLTVTPPPTLTLGLSANPGTTLTAGQSGVQVTHTVGGTATGNIKYSGWYNCPSITAGDLASPSYANFVSKCQDPTNNPAVGFEVDNVTTNPLTEPVLYNAAGSYQYVALVRRSTAPDAAANLNFTVSNPVVTNPPSVTLKLNNQTVTQHYDSLSSSGGVSVSLPFTWVVQNGAKQCTLSRTNPTYGTDNFKATALPDSPQSFSGSLTFANGEPSGTYTAHFLISCAQPSASSSTIDATFTRQSAPPTNPNPGSVLNFGTGSRQW